MQTGWLKDGNTWYSLADSGAMRTGWYKEGNTWYSLANSGAMRTGWYKEGSTWYYLKGSGAMATGWATAMVNGLTLKNQVLWSQTELFQPVMGKVTLLVRMVIC